MLYQGVINEYVVNPEDDGSVDITAEIPEDEKNIEQPVVILLVFNQSCHEKEPEVEVKGCLGW